MPPYNALNETYGGDFGDNTLPIDCNDTAGICTIGTDYIFDALNPACYAAGALPAVGALPVAGLVNLARDVAPALPRTTANAVTATPSDVSHLPVFDGWGLVFNPATQLCLNLHKGVTADKLVNSPGDEGFLDFLQIICFRATALPASAAVFGFNGGTAVNAPNGGFKMLTTGGIQNAVSGVVAGAPALNTLVHLASLYRFNVGANTSTIQDFINGAATGAPYAGRAPGTYLVNNVNSHATLGGGPGWETPTGKLYRAVREYVNVAGVDAAAYVATDYAYCAARFTS